MRKVAIDGYIIHVDMSQVKALVSLLRIYSNNINQIARRLNETNHLYAQDIDDIKTNFGAVWKEVNKILEMIKKNT